LSDYIPFLAADNLEVLSIGRNQIKKLEGLDDVAGTLRELWISYNLIDKLNGLEKVRPAIFMDDIVLLLEFSAVL
jgi:hypothetical protein